MIELLTLQTLKQYKKTLEEGNLFPTTANETIKILKSYKTNKYLKMDEETKLYLDELLIKYGNKYFMIEEE